MVQELSDKGIQHTDLWQRGVDTELFRPELRSSAMRERLLGDHDDRGALLLYVGRLSAEKQIERIKPVLEALPDARLALVGDGPHRQQLEKHFAGTATTFVGYLAGEELASAYASGDAFLFPSSTETLGLVLLEAMAAGCPVVVAFAQNTPGGGSVHALPMAKAVLETWNRTRLGQAAVSASTLSSTPR